MALTTVGSLEHTDTYWVSSSIVGNSTDWKFLEMGVFISSLNCYQIKFLLGDLFSLILSPTFV